MQPTMGTLPEGVVLRGFLQHSDTRGELCEIWRDDAPGAIALRQWNLSRCNGNSLRGVHLHFVHSDYVVVIDGVFVFGLRDLRADKPTYGSVAMLQIAASPLTMLQIPPGVAHGFCSIAGGSIVYGLTHHWDPGDDLGCRWDDPEHGLRFPVTAPILSGRDSSAGSFRDMARAYQARRAG